MSKLGCICGHTIVDQTIDIAYKANFIRDQDFDTIANWTTDVENFINAVKNGRRDQWLNEYFGSDVYKTISDSSVVFDISSRHTLDYKSTIYLCEKCGRIKIQIGNSNKFLSFSPEDKEWPDLFKGLSKTQD